MRKMLISAIVLLLVTWTAACGEGGLPLPAGTEKTDSLCPLEALAAGGTCYKVPLSHYETITWYEDTAGIEGWSLQWATDDEPFLAYLNKDNKKAHVLFYRQPGDQITGLLVRYD
ncbi:hypothetical protein L1N85_26790 [Paenibacillus alkaliterrae]|uniref:hypothetical protein n=1 Tax=Paenibacillus alkaliterrae TaxID=320909 RepID=UPI001F3BBC71|nr:hypothetical protein [Paenibacillus alkaliterrae]MCF2941929.1 hypothetical protein [Paenibacillus alkaliterrae]